MFEGLGCDGRLDGSSTHGCRCFGERLTRHNASWAFTVREPVGAIAALVRFATLIHVILSKPKKCGKGAISISASTDKLGNPHVVSRLMSTKFLLSVFFMKLSAVLMHEDLNLRQIGCCVYKT